MCFDLFSSVMQTSSFAVSFQVISGPVVFTIVCLTTVFKAFPGFNFQKTALISFRAPSLPSGHGSSQGINHVSDRRMDLWPARPCSLAGRLLAQPFPAHLRENRDLCTGSAGTKCFQIKIIFPYALLACSKTLSLTVFISQSQTPLTNSLFIFSLSFAPLSLPRPPLSLALSLPLFPSPSLFLGFGRPPTP